MTENDTLAREVRKSINDEHALRYFDGGRAAFQRRHPNKVHRFPWLAFVWIAAGIGLVVMFGEKLAAIIG